ncbi:hypothetical protein MRB53_040873 [Persea americana]|nr:hypothetical protein MRB53_040873 [Persea americana]
MIRSGRLAASSCQFSPRRCSSHGAANNRGGALPRHRTMAAIHIAWPPKAVLTTQGYVKECAPKHDAARRCGEADEHYYIFGDTFCMDNKGECIGLTNNTIALIPDITRPLESKFLGENKNGTPGLVSEFLPFTKEEVEFNEKNMPDRRVVLWSFGGLVEDAHGAGVGWIPAEVSQTASEPRFGSHSVFKDEDGFLYLLGGGEGLRNFLARVPADADLLDRKNYTYYGRNGSWISEYANLDELQDLLPNCAQGALMKPSWAPVGNPYVYIGVEWWMKSQCTIAVAPRPEGPWELKQLFVAPSINNTSNFRYCIYPHEWSFNKTTGELFVTWSEDNPTRVRALPRWLCRANTIAPGHWWQRAIHARRGSSQDGQEGRGQEAGRDACCVPARGPAEARVCQRQRQQRAEEAQECPGEEV